MTVPLAHMGHVLIDAPIFAGPVVVLGLWVWWTGRREQRRADPPPRDERTDPSGATQ